MSGQGKPTADFVETAVGYSRNYVAARLPSLTPTTEEHISGLCALLEEVQSDRMQLVDEVERLRAALIESRDLFDRINCGVGDADNDSCDGFDLCVAALAEPQTAGDKA